MALLLVLVQKPDLCAALHAVAYWNLSRSGADHEPP